MSARAIALWGSRCGWLQVPQWRVADEMIFMHCNLTESH